MAINFVGEHLLPGQTGNFMLLLAFFTALFSAIYYAMAVNEQKSWALRLQRVARWVFLIHIFTLIFAVGLLYDLIINRYYEYAYVWQYSSNALPLKYIISCFWAGQEGGFLIWAFFQALLGLVVIRYFRRWESPVMAVVSLSQTFLTSALLGIHIFGLKIGGSPFALMRDTMANAGDVFFQDPNYLKQITDGQGLNPLLENVWMVTHPPLLFLGYAASLFPFAFAVASLWKKEYTAWIKPALTWTVFALLTLGGGILLGGSWAYESLTFGGFWSWDPVENASLVPWLILLVTLHLLLIAKRQRLALPMAYIFSMLGFIFVLYASYLTRSGILGDTSAHAFGDDGKSVYLIAYLAVFFILAAVMFILNVRKLPKGEKEVLWSREFWMFAGAVIVLLSAFHIIVTTSIPVFNKIFGSHIAPPLQRVDYYNTWQLPYAVLIAVLIGFTQYLSYGKNEVMAFMRKLLPVVAIAILVSLFIVLATGMLNFTHILLLFILIFSVLASLDYLIRSGGRVVNRGAAVTHAGFGIFLLGVILAFSNSRIISQNTSGIELGDKSLNNQNQVLITGHPMQMGEYWVSYKGYIFKGKRIVYQLDFAGKMPDGSLVKEFSLYPDIHLNPRMGNVHEPATKHFFSKDVYTYVSFADVKAAVQGGSYALLRQSDVTLKDTIKIAGYRVILDSLSVQSGGKGVNDLTVNAYIKTLADSNHVLRAVSRYHVKNDSASVEEGYIPKEGLKFRFEKIADQPRTIVLGVYQKNPDYVVVKAVVFPHIGVLWTGVIVLLAGFFITLWKRINIKFSSINILKTKNYVSKS